MRTPPILSGTLLIAMALLSAGGARSDPRTIHLLCGASGTPCAQDPNVTFTSSFVFTPQHAIVGTGAPADPCAVQDKLFQPGKSRCVTTTNTADTTATFTIMFNLPGEYGNPSLDLLVWMDDWGFAYLNGHQVGILGAACGLPSDVHTTNPLYFSAGTNTLTFFVANGHNCGIRGQARSGPDDAMNLQFEGTVTYDPPPAGGGLNLGWDDCGGAPASLNKTFACDTNSGTNTLVGSFVAPSLVDSMTASEIVMDLQSAGATLPAWWQMRFQFGCRPSALTQSADFTAGPFTCFDYWSGGASGGVIEDFPVLNRARIKMLEGVPVGSPLIRGILEGAEVYSFKCNISNAKTVGSGSCAGCATGVCIVLNSIRISQTFPSGVKFISSPAARAYATWQGGTGSDCYAATPAKNVTWGRIKAQYR